MNLNIVSYCVYLALTVFIIVVVGRICYRNGNIFVSELIPGHEDLCHRINGLLLVGYYLVNIGYAALALVRWQSVEYPQQIVETVGANTAAIVCLLCVLHYLNIVLLTKYANKLIH